MYYNTCIVTNYYMYYYYYYYYDKYNFNNQNEHNRKKKEKNLYTLTLFAGSVLRALNRGDHCSAVTFCTSSAGSKQKA